MKQVNHQSKQSPFQSLEMLEYSLVQAMIADRTSCVYGTERVNRLLPGIPIDQVESEFDRIEELMGSLERGSTLPFNGVCEIRPQLKQASVTGSRLDPLELLKISQTAGAGRILRSFCLSHKDELKLITQLALEIHPLKELEDEILKKIDSSSGEIKDSASKTLHNIRSQLSANQIRYRKKLDQIISGCQAKDWLLETEYTLREGRYVLAVKSQYRSKIKGILHGISSTGGTAFLEPEELVDLGNEKRKLEEEEIIEIMKILDALTSLVRDNSTFLSEMVEIIGHLDSCQARGRFALELKGNRPQFSDEELHLVEARHPLLIARKGLEATVPLNLQLINDNRVLVITGPNAGGKTVTLKTVGLLTALASAGIIPPCGMGTKIPFFQQWHVVIGDDQSLESDLSSFSGHLTRLNAVLQSPVGLKLVLIDEIAAGTDPAEGSALAMAFLQTAVNEGWWSIITTHIGSLKAFAHRTAGIRNGSMQFDRAKLSPTYCFQPDLPGSSYALEIAARVGLPQSLIEQARHYLGSERQRLEDLIEELSQRLTEVEHDNRWLTIKRSETAALEKMLQQRIEQLEQKKSSMTQKAVEQAEELLRNANRAVELAVKEIREKQASSEAIKAAHRLIQEQKDEIEETSKRFLIKERPKTNDVVSPVPSPSPIAGTRETKPIDSTDSPLAVGDLVQLEGGNIGQVLTMKGESLQVAAGYVKIWMNKDQVQKIDKSSGQTDAGGVRMDLKINKDSAPIRIELDLRGMRYEEADIALDKYLEDLTLSGFPLARIVHGKGTGTLRSLVLEKVKSHPLVKAFRLGEPGEGGDGVTILEMR